jgi:hypothetical protein
MSANSNIVSDNMFSVLEAIAVQQIPLAITRTYKGIALHQNVKVLAACDNYAVFQTPDIKTFADMNGTVQLHSPCLDRPVSARLVGRDFNKSTFSLADFTFLPGPWKERLHRRVQPQSPTYLSLRGGRRPVLASLVDLDARGLGLFANSFFLKLAGLRPGSEIRTSFLLAPNLLINALIGQVEYIKTANPRLSRLGIRFYPRRQQEALLESYIERRQAEIFQELDRTFYQSLGPRRVEEQYF